ncbi:hypothetical protein QN277_012676 [Acacia crassicarpa]|uniref:Uncharacterized protein n=1 Tax=Acacia crassicarpa TaxID=499986 RepID=A0AAE1TE03_9FABA|nr:hypothetical protein QN277_012676 [Acacia crassicarpa]
MEGGVDEEMADGMQCSDYPYRTNPHKICPPCFQEKLGKLFSSSLSLRPSTPFSDLLQSDRLLPLPSSSTSLPSSSPLTLPQSQPNTNAYHHHHCHCSRLHFLIVTKAQWTEI